jgi:PilZ domain
MIWTITIATFLGTVVAVLLMFFILSRREQIREAVGEQRIERRTSAKIGVELYGLDEPHTHEIALSENVSRHGARIVTKKRWRPNDRVLVRLPRGDERSRAQIAYCNALPGDVFAIGLQFSSAVDNRLISGSGLSNYQTSVDPFRK